MLDGKISSLIFDDIFIYPNFNESILKECYAKQFTEIFPNTYLIYDHNLIKQVMNNPLLTSHEIGVGNYLKLTESFDFAKIELKGDVLFSDAEQHTTLRAILSKSYMKMRESIPAMIDHVVASHFVSIQELDQVCLSHELATPISEKMFLLLSGLGTAEEFHDFIPFYKSLRLLLNAIDNNLDKNGTLELIDNWKSIFSTVLHKLQNPVHSYPNLISSLSTVDEISEEVKTIMILAFIRAGIENPRSYIVSAAIRYFENPDMYHRDTTRFLDEVMRYDCPAKITARYVSEDITVGGVQIKKGSKIWPSFRLANFSTQIFDDPFTFKLRKPNPNLSLGYGPHFCIGKELTYKLTIDFINSLIDLNYSFAGYSPDYRLEESIVFRRYVKPLFVTKDR
ncbi:MAG: hypothetical protein CK425_10275 [Parachlamydia sp.]|nr:MAG: hypothetical protein CK425_10275 [Parachlamydia sp.]